MTKLNFVGVQKEIEALFRRYDQDGSGLLSAHEFSGGLFGLIPNPGKADSCVPSFPSFPHIALALWVLWYIAAGNPEARTAFERMRAAIAGRGGLNGIRSLARVLRVMDDNGNGKIDREELRSGLLDFGLDMTNKQLDKLFDTFDLNKDGQINMDEFLRGLRVSCRLV